MGVSSIFVIPGFNVFKYSYFSLFFSVKLELINSLYFQRFKETFSLEYVTEKLDEIMNITLHRRS